MRNVGRRLVDIWSSVVWLDYVAVFVVAGAHLLIIKLTGHGDWLKWISSSQRITVYGTGAAIIAIIGGLSAVAVTVYVSADGERARAVRAHYHSELRKNWRALLLGLGVSAGACLVAQALDGKNDPFSSRAIFEAAMILAVCRFLRLVWLFDAIVAVSDRDLIDMPRAEAPQLSRAWHSKLSS
jgi:hypothetical protein